MNSRSIRSGWIVPVIVAIIGAAIVFSAFAWVTGPPSVDASPAPDSPSRAAAHQAAEDLTTVELVEQVSPAVVTVYNLTTLETLLGQEETVPQGTGTGFIIDEEGHIVTNWHVVYGGEEYAVDLADGTTVEAELIGTDPRDDLAVVKIDPADVPATVPLGDSDELQPGQPVVAIGSPLGAFTNTVTAGIVSGLDRDGFGGRYGANCQNYANLIQHDAAINPGNSGGPLFNAQGEVIGVNTLGLPQAGGTIVQGLFFAVPSNLVATVAQQIIETGTISAPFIGVSAQEIDPGTAASLGMAELEGTSYVASVQSGTPAEAAGIQPEDIIIALDGQDLNAEQGLSDLLLEYQPGDTVELTLLRADASGNAEEVTVELTFDTVPEEVFEECLLTPQG